VQRWWLRAAISALAVAALLAFVPVRDVWGAIRDVHPLVWLACLALFVAGHASNAAKLWLLLGGDVPLEACLRAHFAGMAANLGLPGVTGGEIVRVAYLAPAGGAARVTLVAIIDRIIDAAVLALIVVVAVQIVGLPAALSGRLPSAGWTAVVAGTGAALAACAWALLQRRVSSEAVAAASQGVRRRPGVMLVAAAISGGVQIIFVLANVWLAEETGALTDLGPWVLAWSAAKLGAILPISLGGIGVREAALVAVLGAYGASADAVLATGFLWDGAIVAGSLVGFLATQVLFRR
jgi:glycosyltransferase 2 family protein